VFQTVFSVFCFFYAVTITAAAAVFLYLFIKRLCVCVCVSAFIICCVFTCVRAVHSFYFVVFLFRLLKKLPNLFTTLKKPTVILSFFFVCLCAHHTYTVVVCVVFFLLIIVGFMDAYSLYICVYVCCVCLSSPPKKKRQTNFCFVVKHGKTTELDLSSFVSFDGVIIYLYVRVFFLCICTCYFQF